MLTAIDIEEYFRPGIAGALARLRPNRIRVAHHYCDSAAVRSVVYERRRKRTSWASLDRFVGGDRGCVLCRSELVLPSGYRRFESPELSRRLCENAAVYLLQQLGGEDVSVALVDSSGDSLGLCSYLIDYTDDLRVVTDDPGIYLDEADRLIEEYGASIRICAGAADLRGSDLVIAPDGLGRSATVADDAVILCAGSSAADSDIPVICDYSFSLPDKYASIKPPYLDDMYFAGALYSLAGTHELGSEVFTRCISRRRDGVSVHTRGSLIEKLKNRTAARLSVKYS